ncbi:MAG TPA: carboxymuconolactone decarboxylase family protein [Thermoanaerobaculia bacterium]|nr:carboxymuconolactone decarboxylase family protein [Thermoanaerobaculia bacterium]
MKQDLPKPPRAFDAFSERFPTVRKAWDTLGEAGSEGPLDEKTARLVKLAVSIGAMREGGVHSSTRKALALDVTPAELDHVVALCVSTIGFPGSVAVWTWIRDVTEKR